MKLFLIVTAMIACALCSCNKEPFPGENEFMDSRDGKIYKFIQVGNHYWMAENLAYLPSIDSTHLESDTLPHFYVYDYNEPKLSIAKQSTNYFLFGVLYNWIAAMEACPEGWHLPSDNDWKLLEMYFGMNPEDADKIGYRASGEVGEKIKSLYDWEDAGYGIDESGFNAKGGGRRSALSGYFLGHGTQAFFWTSTETGSTNSILRYIERDSVGVYRTDGSRRNALSVRCIKD